MPRDVRSGTNGCGRSLYWIHLTARWYWPIPKMLRVFFKYNRSLLSGLCLCGKEAILKYFKAATGRKLAPRIIAVIQSFGARRLVTLRYYGLYSNAHRGKMCKRGVVWEWPGLPIAVLRTESILNFRIWRYGLICIFFRLLILFFWMW